MTPANQSSKAAYWIYFSGLVLLAVSLPLSKFTMSVSQFLIVGGWLFDGHLAGKWKQFLHNKLALLIASVYLLHVVGLAWTSDFDYAFKDLRIKLPMLLLPLIFSTGPSIRTEHFRFLLKMLIAAVVASTAISFMVYSGVIKRPINDIRDISIFISHIRLALLVCLSICVGIWLITTSPVSRRMHYVVLFGAITVWLVYFLLLIESLTGIVILITTGLVTLGIYAFNKSGKPGRIIAMLIIVGIPIALTAYLVSVNKDFSPRENISADQLEKYTASGAPYEHNPGSWEYENGHSVWNYICEQELEKAWNARSKMTYSGHDHRNQELRMTLIRFLSSKGLRKDKEGVAALSDAEVKSVERGIANVKYQHLGNTQARVHQVLWELHHYKRTGNPSGHSAAQRLEFWKAATSIISQNLFIGVGTGDVPDAFELQYDSMNSQLSEQRRLRAHNQFLALAVAFGLPGMLLFMVSLIVPLVARLRLKDFLYISFSIISIISMLTEDTLETQAGVTFFTFFTGLFLFVNPSFPSTDGKRGSST